MQRDGFQCLTIPRTGRYRFEVIGPSWVYDAQGAQIIGEDWLKKGEKITIALGQRGNIYGCGNGGTFVVNQNGTPLYVAGGGGCAIIMGQGSGNAGLDDEYENDKIGSSGVQELFANDENDFFSGGSDFLEEPVTGKLREDSVAPKSYKDGLIGGKGIDDDGGLLEGGFGGGGAMYCKNGRRYFGAGGGYTGGGTKILDDEECVGCGGGSFTIDIWAQFDHVVESYGKCTITYLD